MSYCGVIGYPVSHSLSPALHQRAYELIGCDWQFVKKDVSPDELDAFVSLLDKQCVGLAVTMPHKAAIMRYGVPDELSARVGAANTFLVQERRLYNTDTTGFLRVFQHHDLVVNSVRVLGAGSTTRAVLAALHKYGCQRVTICVRNVSKDISTVEFAKRLGFDVHVCHFLEPVEPADLLVSCLPPFVADRYVEWALDGVQSVLDVAYEPWPTQLCQNAEHAGLVSMNGLHLLAGQAIGQIHLMTHTYIDFDVLYRAGLAELAARSARSM